VLDKRITFGTGVAGSGKSFVCLAAALRLLQEDNSYKKILIVTPTVEAGNMEIGFLKGSKEDKIQPYLEADYATIQDILEMNGNDSEYYLNKLIDSGLVKGECVNFMRGKTLKNTIVIITEAENFNKQEMWLLLSRIHPSSKYIINGDNRQQDRKDITKNTNNGLKHAMNTLKGKLDTIGFCHFTKEDIVRDPIIEEIMNLWFDPAELSDEY
jgi:phosphate starvation-inducible PhoH-like protein